jgi:WD40 repeat protein/serine/threonine protein kinase/tetratricopeptide (TPR) repeat protein
MPAQKNARDIFLGALDRAPAERAAYLDAACGGDAALRQRVEALLKAHDDPEAFLSEAGQGVSDAGRGRVEAPPRANDAAPPSAPEATVDSADGQPGTADSADPTARVGALLAGRYKLVEAIGEGGMGTVYMAQQTEPVKRAVAVKVIKAGMDSKAVLARFEAERQALAMMDHPNIAKVLDAGTTDGGRPFFVMELVKGTPITRYCDEHRLTPRQRLELFVPVCQAIQHAHQKGVIHRDIKPSNVLVALYDDRAVPKVIDFGVAKAAGQSLTDKTLMTGFGALVGTPEYMSPEQASLNNLDIDTRSDVYSLGVLLYELLTGTTPVDKKTLGQAALLEILRIVREVEAPRPSAKLSTIDTLPSVAANRGTEPARLSRLMKGELDWLVMKALEKDRSRRYETANALSRDIQRYLADEVVEARPPSVGYRLRKFVRRHKGQVIAASLVLLALVGGIVGTTLGLFEARRQEDEARKQEKIARDEAAAKEEARSDEAQRVKERDEALGKRDMALGETKDALARESQRVVERDKANGELTHRLGVSAMVLANAAYDSRDYKLATERLDKVPADQRGWEWRHLKRQLNGGIFTLHGHTSAVTSVAFSPDGTRIVTGGGGQGSPFEAKVWDARTGMYLFDLMGLPPRVPGVNEPVVCVAFSADSKRIVTAGGDKTARVWDAMTGALQLELKDATRDLESAAFSPDGTQITTAGYAGVVRLWDARSGKVQLDWRTSSTSRLAFSQDGTRILTGGTDQAVRLWDAKTGKLLLEAKGMMTHFSSVALSPDGKRIVAGRDDGTARVIDAQTGVVLLELNAHPRVSNQVFATAGVLGVAFSPDGTRIVTGGTTGGSGTGGGFYSGEASVWDARTGAELLQLKGHAGMVMSVAFSPDGERIITGSLDGTAKVWDARTGTPRLGLEGSKSPTASASFSPDGAWMVTGGGDRRGGAAGEATVWDARTGMARFTLKGLKGSVNCVAVSKDGTRVVTGGGADREDQQPSGEATLWDARTGAPLVELKGLKEPVNSVAFSPDGTRILTAGALDEKGTELKVWDATTGAVLLDLTEKEQPVTSIGERGGSVAFSPDGLRFVVGGMHTVDSEPSQVKVRDARTGAVLVEMKGNKMPVLSVAFSLDGTRIAAGDLGNTVTISDAQTGTALVELKGHTGNVFSVAFSPDGKRLVTGSGDRTARVWDARTGVTLAELKGHTGGVTSVSFSADGSRILTAAGGSAVKPGEVFVWDAPIPKQELELVGHTAYILAAAFSPDGTRIATGSHDKTVKVWDVRTGATLLDLKGPTADVGHLAFSADGTRVVSCDFSTARVWDAKTGSALLELKGHGYVQQAAFSPDGTRIVTGGIKEEKGRNTGVAIVWDATSGKALVEVNGIASSVDSVAFSPDGTRFFTDSRLGTMKAWDASTGKEVPGAAIPPMNRGDRTSPDGRFFARVIQDRVAVVPLMPDADEMAYRRLHTQPNPSHYRASYLAARAAKDDFAAAFYLNLTPPDERKALISQADADGLAAMSRLADECWRAGKLEEEVPLRIEILNANKAKLGPEAPTTIEAANRLANVYRRMGQFEKAIPLWADFLKYRTAKSGRENPGTLSAMWQLGWAYKETGRLPEAIALLEEAAAKNPHPVWTRTLLDAYELAGEHAKVIDRCQKQLAEDRKARPEADPDTDLLARLGRAYLVQKKWAEAEPHLRECVTWHEKNQPEDWRTFDAQSLLGGSLLGQKKYAEAEPLLLKGYEGLKPWEKALEPRDAARVPEALDRLIELYTATNKPDEAKKWREERAKYREAKNAAASEKK